MKLFLFHGRDNPKQEMQGWGFDGPILSEIAWVKYTCGGFFLGFEDSAQADAASEATGWDFFDENIIEVRFTEYGLVEASGKYYGDFEIKHDDAE